MPDADPPPPIDAVILISADAEWQPVRARYPDAAIWPTPYGESFAVTLPGGERPRPVVFFHGGWGKIDAAASAQYAIDRWRPRLLINMGVCGGFAGDVSPGEILLVDFALVYDILERMGDPQAALAHYATEIDLSWLPAELPLPARRELLISADRDIIPGDVAGLRDTYGAIAADWESGAIAHVAARNGTRCLILRAVTDLVSYKEGEAYGRPELFATRTEAIMNRFLDSVAGWLEL